MVICPSPSAACVSSEGVDTGLGSKGRMRACLSLIPRLATPTCTHDSNIFRLCTVYQDFAKIPACYYCYLSCWSTSTASSTKPLAECLIDLPRLEGLSSSVIRTIDLKTSMMHHLVLLLVLISPNVVPGRYVLDARRENIPSSSFILLCSYTLDQPPPSLTHGCATARARVETCRGGTAQHSTAVRCAGTGT